MWRLNGLAGGWSPKKWPKNHLAGSRAIGNGWCFHHERCPTWANNKSLSLRKQQRWSVTGKHSLYRYRCALKSMTTDERSTNKIILSDTARHFKSSAFKWITALWSCVSASFSIESFFRQRCDWIINQVSFRKNCQIINQRLKRCRRQRLYRRNCCNFYFKQYFSLTCYALDLV